MRVIEVTLAILDEIAIAWAIVLAPLLVAYKLNIIGFEEVLVIAIILVAIAAFVVYKVVEVHRREVKVGIETYIGKKATVVDIRNSKIIVMVEGELWNAECEQCNLSVGDKVEIVGYGDGKFKVKPLK